MPPTTRATFSSHWAASRVAALPEFWTLVAEHVGLVGAHRLKLVCKAAKLGADEYVRTLKTPVLCGGRFEGFGTKQVWRLDLGTLQWERLADLSGERNSHACCVVRGHVVVIGGEDAGPHDNMAPPSPIATVEVLRGVDNSSNSQGALSWSDGRPLSCGPRCDSVALTISENHSEEGKALLLGGHNGGHNVDIGWSNDDVVQVDLATGACSNQAHLSRSRLHFAASRMPDGRVVCAGGMFGDLDSFSSAEIFEPPEDGSTDGAWCWRELPDMSVARECHAGCVMSDGRFAVFGGKSVENIDQTTRLSSCEVLCLDGHERWEPLPNMLEPRYDCVCVSVGGCIIVAGGYGNENSMEVYEEALGVWRRLPCTLPYSSELHGAGFALV